ncbi:hypothetical protein DUT91_20975 [Phyllobacterium salinisoli]|uniref:Uncharacterized protein n=1 Tax=Phyllobacterium salinisoli TaxID=1899321 RepID=A0A368JXJ8_9HYPH|nr:hypothetical protein DUT91_20975 [Phyllobacterium salinisoli]
MPCPQSIKRVLRELEDLHCLSLAETFEADQEKSLPGSMRYRGEVSCDMCFPAELRLKLRCTDGHRVEMFDEELVKTDAVGAVLGKKRYIGEESFDSRGHIKVTGSRGTGDCAGKTTKVRQMWSYPAA